MRYPEWDSWWGNPPGCWLALPLVIVLLFLAALFGCGEWPTRPYAPTWRCSTIIRLDTFRIALEGPAAVDNYCADRAASVMDYQFCRMRARGHGDTILVIQRNRDDCWISYFPQGHRPGQPDRF